MNLPVARYWSLFFLLDIDWVRYNMIFQDTDICYRQRIYTFTNFIFDGDFPEKMRSKRKELLRYKENG